CQHQRPDTKLQPRPVRHHIKTALAKREASIQVLMEYLGPAVLTLSYNIHGQETTLTYTGVTVTLFNNEPACTWTVMMDDHTNQIPLEGLTRAVVSLPDGREFSGATRLTPPLGGGFLLLEDGREHLK
ncbi:hypothetical protein ACIOWK_33770, partial [Pseudomonas protegens]|uniref:hypothetical protein n=1 Tax=Pseudomonas protegens TaxID=380021 RepID=UPI00381D25EA